MKKLFLIPLTAVFITLLTGCNTAEKEEPIDASSTQEVKASIEITGTDTIEVGGYTLLSLSTKASNGGFIWESSDNSVATVENGLVHGLKEGRTTITATNDVDFSQKATIEIKVLDDLDGEFSVQFLNYDGTLLYETHVAEGETAVYQGPTPSRLNTYDIRYEFLKWDRDLSNVQDDIVTTAVYSESDFSEYLFEDLGTSYKIIGYCGDESSIVTPTSFNGKPVSAIGSYIFGEKLPNGNYNNNKTIEHVVVSEGIDTIENYAFSNNENLKSVSLPGSVYNLGTHTFYYDTALEEVTLTDGITLISNQMFSQCHALTSIDIPDSVTTIDNNGFFMSGLTEITLGENVTTVNQSAFANCSELTSITFEAPLVTLGTGVFSTCRNLTEVNYTSFGDTIPQSSFLSCSSLVNFEMSDDVKYVGMQAFRNCESLTNLVFSRNLVGFNADSSFDGTPVFERAEDGTYPNFHVKSGDTSTKIENGMVLTNGYKRVNYILEDFTLENGLFDCEALGVTELGDYVFDSNEVITSINLNGVTYYGEECLYRAGSNGLEIVGGSTLTLNEDVTYVGSAAFQKFKTEGPNITALIINTDFGGTKTIPYRAFRNMLSLERVVIDSNIETIDNGAFGWCSTNLKYVYIPKTVKSIAAQAFYSNNNLIVHYEGTEEEWDAIAKESNSFSNGVEAKTVFNATPDYGTQE